MSETPPVDPELLSGDEASAAEVPEMLATPSRFLWRRIVVWIIALAAGVAVPILVPVQQRADWFLLALGLCVLITFALQLGTAQREGFITRIASSIAGSVVIIALAEAVAQLVS